MKSVNFAKLKIKVTTLKADPFAKVYQSLVRKGLICNPCERNYQAEAWSILNSQCVGYEKLPPKT